MKDFNNHLSFIGLSEPAAFHYNIDTDECSCYAASEHKIMRVYPSHHSTLNHTTPTADFYLVELNVYGKLKINISVHAPTHTHTPTLYKIVCNY